MTAGSGELFSLLNSMGWEQRTNVVVLGDHCQKDVSMAIYPNYWFRKKGWITAQKGMVKEWRVLARECDRACYIYLKNRKDRELEAQVRRWLYQWKEDENSGLEQIFEQPQIRSMGANRDCTFMLEAKDGYFYQNECEVPFQQAGFGSGLHAGDPRLSAHQGELPDDLLRGRAGFYPRARYRSMRLVDEGPLLARVLGVSLGDTDGECPEVCCGRKNSPKPLKTDKKGQNDRISLYIFE